MPKPRPELPRPGPRKSNERAGAVASGAYHPLYWEIGMIYVFATLHVIACLFLIIVVLLQSGQAADLAGAFGGMGSQTVFGPRGSATVMTKATAWAAVIFMLTSLSLAIMGTRRGSPAAGSVLNNRVKSAPAAPAKQQPKPAAPKK